MSISRAESDGRAAASEAVLDIAQGRPAKLGCDWTERAEQEAWRRGWNQRLAGAPRAEDVGRPVDFE